MSEEHKDFLTTQEISDLINKKMLGVQARTRVAPASHQVFKHQADAYVTQASAVSGTKYAWSTDGSVANAIGTQTNVRIISIAALDDWSVDTTSIEVHVTIDGVAFIFIVDPNDDTWYFADLGAQLAPAANVLTTTDNSITRAFLLEGRSVKVEVESTGGTSDTLWLRVRWAKIP